MSTSIHAAPGIPPEGAPADPTSVYRYYDRNDVLIYVGITKQGMGRNLQHNGRAEWWQYVTRQEVEHLPSRPAAMAREQALIREHLPPFNRQHNPGHEDIRAAYLFFMSTPAPDESALEQYTALPRTGGKRGGKRWMPLDGPAPYSDGPVLISRPEFTPLASVLTMPRPGVPVYVYGNAAATTEVARLERRAGVLALHLRGSLPATVTSPRALIRWQGISGTPLILRVFLDNAGAGGRME